MKNFKKSCELGCYKGPSEYLGLYRFEYLESAPPNIAELLELALKYENEYPENCYYIGECYKKGLGVEKNLNIAYRYYLKAAPTGLTRACIELSKLNDRMTQNRLPEEKIRHFIKIALDYRAYREYAYVLAVRILNSIATVQDYKDAIKYLGIAKDYNDGDAYYKLGMLHKDGKGTRVDMKAAADCFKLAKENDSINGAYELALCYYYGRGTDKNLVAAASLFHYTGYRGDGIGLYNYGICLEFGYGEDQSESRALDVYKKCVKDHGMVDAMFKVGSFYKNGDGVTKNGAEAVTYFKMGALKKDVRCKRELGFCVETGFGTKVNVALARTFYKEAIDEGDTYSNYYLGKSYLKDVNNKSNLQLAVKHLKTAIDKGHDEALFSYGHCLCYGIGIESNKAKGMSYMKQGADKKIRAALEFYPSVRYRETKNVREYMAYMKNGIEVGSVACAYYYADECLFGEKGSAKNIPEGLTYMRKAAYSGHRDAQEFYGNILYQGAYGLNADKTEGLALIRRSALQGSADGKIKYRR